MAKSQNNSVFSPTYHLVLVTKYRRKALSVAMRVRCQEIMQNTLRSWRCSLIEFGSEPDHVHLLFAAHPALDLSRLVNSLKTVSSRLLRQEFVDELAVFYWKPFLWHGAYSVGTVGNASLEVVKRYVEQQGQKKFTSKRR